MVMADGTWQVLADEIAERGRALGLDLSASFRIGDYNEQVAAGARIDDGGNPGNLAVVIGNTRALWLHFVAALREQSELLESKHPLDAYVVSSVRSILESLPVPGTVRWAHEPEPAYVSVQTAAEVAGLAYRGESGLCVHPKYGPWIALRAIVVFPVVGPAPRAPSASPCDQCQSLCKPAFEYALAHDGGKPSQTSIAKGRRLWLAVRDACPLGTEHRYSEDQIRYHYVKDVELLRSLL